MNKLIFSILILLSNFTYSQLNTVTINPVEDTYVYLGNKPQNYSTSTTLNIYNSGPSNYYISRALLKFNVKSYLDALNLPSNAVIHSAKLELTIQTQNPTLVNPSSELTLRKITSSWLESSASWNVQPSTTTSNQVSSLNITSGKATFDVKTLVTRLYRNQDTDFGWAILLNPEGTVFKSFNFYSSNQTVANAGLKPKLIIEYYIPFSITSALVKHSSSLSSNDGAITATISNGSGSPTYKWHSLNQDGSTTLITGSTNSLTGLTPGIYGLEITGSVGEKYYYAFIVGSKCGNFLYSFLPDERFVEDDLYGDTYGTNWYTGSSQFIKSSYIYTNPGILIVGTEKTIIKFNLWVDSDLTIQSAQLRLTGSGHSGNSNSSKMYFNNSLYSEDNPNYVSGNTYLPPTYHNLIPNPISIAHTTGNSVVDIKSFFDIWKNNNATNNGLTVISNTTSGTVQQIMSFASSENTTVTSRPRVDFNIQYVNQSPCVCDPVYSHPTKHMSGTTYRACDDKLDIVYNEEYFSGTSLNYKIKNISNQVVISTSNQNKLKYFGDNRIQIDISNLPIGVFTLEITNDKKETFYLKFSHE